MTQAPNTSLATLDDLIHRQEQVLAALVAARTVMAGDAPPAARKPEVKLLQAPAKKRSRKAKPEAPAANDDAIEHELEDVTLTVSPLQSAILDCLGAADDAVPGPVLVKTVGKSKSSVDKAIDGLRQLLKNAGSKVELNGYRKRGFVLEMERD